MPTSKSEAIRARLSHPVIDGDAHYLEFAPLFYDYVRDVATSIGLEPRDAVPFQPRMESGLPVRGTLHVLHKPR